MNKARRTGAGKRVRETTDILLDIRVAVWDALNLLPLIEEPARKRLKYAARKLTELLQRAGGKGRERDEQEAGLGGQGSRPSY